jgi:hypothetical protein
LGLGAEEPRNTEADRDAKRHRGDGKAHQKETEDETIADVHADSARKASHRKAKEAHG